MQAFRCLHFLLHVLVHVPEAAEVSPQGLAETLNESLGMHAVWTNLASSAYRPSDALIFFCMFLRMCPRLLMSPRGLWQKHRMSPRECRRSGPISLPTHAGPQMLSFSCACSCACGQGCSGLPAASAEPLSESQGMHAVWANLASSAYRPEDSFILLHVPVHAPRAAQVSLQASAETLNESQGMHAVWTNLASSAYRPSDVFISFALLCACAQGCSGLQAGFGRNIG